MSQPKLRLFFDESGNLSKEDFYFACIPIYNYNKKRLESVLEQVFKEKNIDWRVYHACRNSKKLNKEILKKVKELYPELQIYISKLIYSKENNEKLYYPCLIETILNILKKNRETLCIDIVVEHRENVDGKSIEYFLQEMAHKELLLRNLQIRFAPVMKGDNILLILCDIVGYLAYNKETDILNLCKANYIIIKPERLFIHDYKKFVDLLFEKRIIVKKEKIIEYQNDIRKIKNKLEEYKFDINNTQLSFKKILSIFEKSSEKKAILESLLDTAGQYKENKNFDKLIVFTEFVIQAILNFCNKEEFAFLYLKAVNLWLVGFNHKGEFKAEHDYVQQAKELVDKVKHDSTYFEQIADLYNHISVSYQNKFEFDKAIEVIKPCVKYFEEIKSGPFGEIKSRYIGALFGNYSQCLFFSAHTSYLKNLYMEVKDLSKEKKKLENTIEEGILYSSESEFYFKDQKERNRQIIYRAHAYLMGYLLTNDEKYIQSANSEIERAYKINSPDKLISKFPNIHIDKMYYLALYLKYAWLTKKEDINLSKVNLNLLENTPIAHPCEQILGYLALLGIKEAYDILSDKGWKGLILWIALLFRLQYVWENQKRLDFHLLNKLKKISLSKDFTSPYLSYLDEIDKFSKYDFFKGPLIFLPYNYS